MKMENDKPEVKLFAGTEALAGAPGASQSYLALISITEHVNIIYPHGICVETDASDMHLSFCPDDEAKEIVKVAAKLFRFSIMEEDEPYKLTVLNEQKHRAGMIAGAYQAMADICQEYDVGDKNSYQRISDIFWKAAQKNSSDEIEKTIRKGIKSLNGNAFRGEQKTTKEHEVKRCLSSLIFDMSDESTATAVIDINNERLFRTIIDKVAMEKLAEERGFTCRWCLERDPEHTYDADLVLVIKFNEPLKDAGEISSHIAGSIADRTQPSDRKPQR